MAVGNASGYPTRPDRRTVGRVQQIETRYAEEALQSFPRKDTRGREFPPALLNHACHRAGLSLGEQGNEGVAYGAGEDPYARIAEETGHEA